MSGRAIAPEKLMSNLRMSSPMKLLTSILCALVLVLGASLPARAQGTDGQPAQAPHGQISLRADAPGAPVELAPEGGDGHVGSFLIENVGLGPLKVARVAVRTSAQDPRTPPGVTAELEGGGSTATNYQS